MASLAVVASAGDNVATAISDLAAGTTVLLTINDQDCCLLLTQDIPFGHKFALCGIAKGQHIIKYGESIGVATRDIPQGSYVHVHNVDSQRGRGDLE